jgi:hypothetical protein
LPLNRYCDTKRGWEDAFANWPSSRPHQFERAAREPEALREGITREIIEIIKHRLNTSGLEQTDAIIIELGREIFGARKVAPTTFARHCSTSAGALWSISSR